MASVNEREQTTMWWPNIDGWGDHVNTHKMLFVLRWTISLSPSSSSFKSKNYNDNHNVIEIEDDDGDEKEIALRVFQFTRCLLSGLGTFLSFSLKCTRFQWVFVYWMNGFPFCAMPVRVCVCVCVLCGHSVAGLLSLPKQQQQQQQFNFKFWWFIYGACVYIVRDFVIFGFGFDMMCVRARVELLVNGKSAMKRRKSTAKPKMLYIHSSVCVCVYLSICLCIIPRTQLNSLRLIHFCYYITHKRPPSRNRVKTTAVDNNSSEKNIVIINYTIYMVRNGHSFWA